MDHYTIKSFTLTHSVGFMLSKARNLIVAEMDAALKDLDITSQQMGILLSMRSGMAATPFELSKLLGIDTGRDKQRRGLANFGRKLCRLLVNRDRVQIDDAENTFVLPLYLGPVFERSEIITNVELSGRLNTGKNACFHAGRESLS